MAMITCPECGKEVSDKANSCPHCGAPIAKNFCKFCGERIEPDCVICPKCGKQVNELSAVKPDRDIIINNNNNASASTVAVPGMPKAKNKWVAFFLCLFLGFIGAHKFYEGKIIFGIVYVLTLGLLGIGAVVDLILILLKPNPYYV